MEDCISYFQAILDTADSGNNIKISLIKKTASKEDEKKRYVLDVEVDGEVSSLLSENLTKYCHLILNDAKLKYDDFFSESIDDNIMFVINEKDMKSIKTLNPIISNIIINDDSKTDGGSERENESKSVTDFTETTINNLLGYSVFTSRIWNDDNEKVKDICISFRKYLRGSKISKPKESKIQKAKSVKKTKLLGLFFRDLKTGKFSVVDGDVFKFDEGIDAIYYERRYLTNSTEKDIKIMFVKNVENFEEVFYFDDFYRQNAQKAYDSICSYENIKIKDELYNNLIKDRRNLKKICKLQKKNVFSDIDFERFYKIFNIASLNYKLDLIVNNKTIEIENAEAFTNFLDICDSENKLFSDILDHSRILSGFGKELPKK